MGKSLLANTNKYKKSKVQEKKVPDKSLEKTDEKVDSKYTTPEEDKALSAGAEEIVDKKTKVSTEKMEKAVSVIQDNFNLADKGYIVNSFADGGTSLKLSLSNSDFEISVKIKDAEKYGLF
jgi:hypothetical protein